MLTTQDTVFQAIRFVTVAHGDQKRKYTGDPYVVHLLDVHATIQKACPNDFTLQVAALLHDTLEDTSTQPEEIYHVFGAEVCALVQEVTDVSKPSDGNRQIRKALDCDHLAKASPRGKSLKLADLLDNTSSILSHDPDFARVYMHEKRRLLAVLTDSNCPALYEAACDRIRWYFSED